MGCSSPRLVWVFIVDYSVNFLGSYAATFMSTYHPLLDFSSEDFLKICTDIGERYAKGQEERVIILGMGD